MKVLAICVVTMGLTRSAAAGPEGDIEAIVTATIDHLADARSADHFAKGATVIGYRANVFDFDSTTRKSGAHDTQPIDFVKHGKLWPMVFGREAPSGTRTLGKVTVVVDVSAKAGWFQAPLALSDKRAMHVSGIAELQGARWLLRVLDIEPAIPNAELTKYPVLAPRLAQQPATPSTRLGKEIVAWFIGRALAKHAASGDVLAGGSAPEELAVGSAARKFAAGLDRLDLVPVHIEASDATGFAYGTAFLPISKRERDGVIELGFAVYAVQEGGAWKWRSIQFACDQVFRE